MNRTLRNFLIVSAAFVAVVFVWKLAQRAPAEAEEISFDQFILDLEEGRIARATVPGTEVVGEYDEAGDDGAPRAFRTVVPESRDLVEALRGHDVEVTVRPTRARRPGGPLVTVLSWLPMLFVVGVWLYFMRQLRRVGPRRADHAGPV